MKFNYRNFLKNETFKHPLKILDGGLVVKSEGSASVRDDADGSLINFEITEQKDDLVNLVYSQTKTFGDLSKKTASSSYNPDKIAKIKGQSIGNDIGNVTYHTPTSSNPFINVDRNRGTSAPLEDLQPVDLIPAYKLIGEDGNYVYARFPIDFVQTYENDHQFCVHLVKKYTVKEDSDIGVVSTAFRDLAYNYENPENVGQVTVKIDGADIEMPSLNGEYNVIRVGYGNFNDDNSGRLISFSRIWLESVDHSFPVFPVSTTKHILTTPNIRISRLKQKTALTRWVDTNFYSLFGLWGEPKTVFDSDHTNEGGFITKKTLKRKLKDVANTVNKYGIDVVAIPYMEKLVELEGPQTTNIGPWYKEIKTYHDDGTSETHYYEDVNESCLRREYKKSGVDFINVAEVVLLGVVGFLLNDDWRDANFTDAIKRSKNFISRKYAQANPAITPTTSSQSNADLVQLQYNDLSPYDSSARDVLIAMYGPRDELYAELFEYRQIGRAHV